MIRRHPILTTAALALCCSLSASTALAATYEEFHAGGSGGNEYQDLRSPDARDAAQQSAVRKPDSEPYVLDRSYGSPDAADAARNLPPVQTSAAAVEAGEPSGGFDWGDAGIGAAGMLGLFSIAAGSALLIASRRRRGGFGVAH